MTLGSTLTRVAQFAPAVALAFGVATANAQSLKIDKCYDVATIAGLLKQDKQNNIAQAYEVDGANTARRYYANEDGSLGYDLKGNLPYNQKQTEYCVKEILTTVTPLSRELSTPPTWLGVTSGDGVHASDIAKAYSLGSRFTLVAQSLAERNGSLFKSNKIGVLTRADGNGTVEQVNPSTTKSVGNYTVKGFVLTQHGEALYARMKTSQDMAQAPVQPISPGTMLASNLVPAPDRKP